MNDEQILQALINTTNDLYFLNYIEVCCEDFLDALHCGHLRFRNDKHEVYLDNTSDVGIYYINYCPFCGKQIEAKHVG